MQPKDLAQAFQIQQKNLESDFIGYDALSDYLNIGKEEIFKHWTDVPSHKDSLVYQKGREYKRKWALVFYRAEVDKWVKEKGFKDLKSPVMKSYKEPLKKVEDGFGYYGTVTTTKDGSGIQCHLCGKFFTFLPGHLFAAHKIKGKEYKERFDLARETALCSDNHREKMRKMMAELVSTWTPEYRQEIQERCTAALAKNPHTGFSLRLETKNKRGTCPDQLLDKLRECAQALGKSPSKKEFIRWCNSQRYVHKIFDTFESWSDAKRQAGLGLSENKNRPKTEYKYSKEKLIEDLKRFYKETGEIPTYTDFSADGLPSYGAYIREFGSITNAREAAGIPQKPKTRTGMKYGIS